MFRSTPIAYSKPLSRPRPSRAPSYALLNSETVGAETAPPVAGADCCVVAVVDCGCSEVGSGMLGGSSADMFDAEAAAFEKLVEVAGLLGPLPR